MRHIIILLALVMLLLLMTGNAGAMFSDNYRLDWFTPMTGGGGGPTGSTNYAVNLTVGQAVIGACSSDNNGASLGYWSGAGTPNHIYLPLLLRH